MRIIMIDVDTLRPDHMGCYGYERNTTPQMDKIARDGMRFENYYCSDAPCLPSRAALVTGKFGIHSGIVNHGGLAADIRHPGPDRFMFNQGVINNLFFMFRSAGMYTVSVSTFAERHSAYWFNAGFNETINVGKIGSETANEVMPNALEWIGRCGKENGWFMHIHMWDPHSPYNTPEDFGNPFEDAPAVPWITEDVLKEHKKHVGPHSINELNMFDDKVNPKWKRMVGKGETLSDVKKIIDGYDCGVRYVDTQVGYLVDLLKRLGIYEDTAIIITADHGENLGELGIYSEHATADNTTTRIPLIIKWPGMKQGVDQGLHYNIDLTRTFADLLGQEPIPDGDGQSFIETLRTGADTGRNHLIVSQCAHVCQRSVRFDDYIYIRTYHDGYHLFPREMLFNIKEDVHEQENLADQEPQLCDRAARLLLDWEEDMMLSSPSETDPMWVVIREGGPFNCSGRLGEYLDRLEATGRHEGAEELRRRHPKEIAKKKRIPHIPPAIARNAH